MSLRGLVLFLLLFLSSNAIFAVADCFLNLPIVPLSSVPENMPLGKYLMYFPKVDSSLSIQEIISEKLYAEKPISNKRDKLTINGFDKEGIRHWAGFSIKNISQTPLSFYIHLDHPVLERVHFYTINNEYIWTENKGGTYYPSAQRALPDRTFLYPILLAPNEKQTFIFAFQYYNYFVNLPISIKSEKHLLHHQTHKHTLLGMYQGVLVLIFALGIYFSFLLKEMRFLLPSIQAFCAFLTNYFSMGFWTEDWPFYSNEYITAIGRGFGIGVMITDVLIFYYFTEGAPKVKWIRKGLLWAVPILAAQILIGYLGPFGSILVGFTYLYTATIINICLTIFCINLLYLRHLPLRFFSAAYLTAFVSNYLVFLNSEGEGSNYLFTTDPIILSYVFMYVLHALAAFDAVKIYKLEKEKAQEESIKQLETTNQLTALVNSGLEERIRETELTALKAQMNPHFVFNSLSTVQALVSSNKQQEAITYLHDFSKLTRQTLDHSTKNFIPLSDEIAFLKSYINLEILRYDKKVEIEFNVSELLDLEMEEIPPMIIQPYIENAFKHGLSAKNGNGKLGIQFDLNAKEELVCTITDNGIGREMAQKFKSKKPTHTSKAMNITAERLEYLNGGSTLEKPYSVTIEDLYSPVNLALGTKVTITFALTSTPK